MLVGLGVLNNYFSAENIQFWSTREMSQKNYNETRCNKLTKSEIFLIDFLQIKVESVFFHVRFDWLDYLLAMRD